jgi:hypothetical protein
LNAVAVSAARRCTPRRDAAFARRRVHPKPEPNRMPRTRTKFGEARMEAVRSGRSATPKPAGSAMILEM